jgi:hypothetical protein
MKLNVKVYTTLPTHKSHWWQVVLIPTVSILNNIQKTEPYVAINIEWLFWSITTVVGYGKKEQPYATR